MKKTLAAAVAAAACASAAPAMAQSVGVAGGFSKGKTHLVATAGTGYAFDESYLVLGLGASYYLFDGFNVGLFYESWTGSNPKMTKITPSVQYVFYQVQHVKPYVGAFYRRSSIDGLDDLDSVGGRAGVFLQAGRNAYFGLGAVYESYIDCNTGTYRKCSSTYGEASLTFAF
jgi:opacity protein-like surface antigen